MKICTGVWGGQNRAAENFGNINWGRGDWSEGEIGCSVRGLRLHSTDNTIFIRLDFWLKHGCMDQT